MLVKRFREAEKQFLKELPKLRTTMKTAERKRLIRNYKAAKEYVERKNREYINSSIRRKSLEREKTKLEKLLKSV